MKMGDLLDIDKSGALWVILLDKNNTKPGSELYEWIKESEGHINAYISTMEKLKAKSKEMYDADNSLGEELDKKFKDIQIKLMDVDVEFKTPIPVYEYSYISKLKQMTASMIMVLEKSGMVSELPTDLEKEAEKNSSDKMESIVSDLFK